MRAKIGREDIIKLCNDIFIPVWRKRLEKVVNSIDERFQISLPEKYMSLPLSAAKLETAAHWQSLIIGESLAFDKKMASYGSKHQLPSLLAEDNNG